MKAFRLSSFSGVNIIIYLVLLYFAVAMISQIWELGDALVFNPEEFSGLRLDRPIIHIYNDVFFYLHEDILENDPQVYQRVQRNELIFKTVRNVAFLTLISLVLLQLRSVVASLRKETFFLAENLKCVRKMSTLLLIWVVVDIMLYQSIQFFIPEWLVQDTINYTTMNESILCGFLLALDFKVLLAAFAFYVISAVFKEGLRLKEQTDYTI